MDRAKKYSNIKYGLAIIDTVYTLILILLFLSLGFSQRLSAIIYKMGFASFFSLPIYLLAVFIAYYILTLPFIFYGSFLLEHQFSLSNQKIEDWFSDQIKGSAISFIISLIALEVFYYLLKQSPGAWWIFVSVFWIFFTLILARLAPVIIIPLFFKYKKITDQTLRQRIMSLAEKTKVKILDVFEIDFSKKTQKANAAFVGLGRTKRVILADTLKDKYSYDEIEVILAHEFAHYKFCHLLKLVILNSLTTLLSFYLIFKTHHYFLEFFKLSSLSNIASLPLVGLYLIFLSILFTPVINYISRCFERNADQTALRITGLKDTFISMMNKLSLQNLSDNNPCPLIKIFFFDHPPVSERIEMAKSFK
jgi:STE24 endopeptidase